MFINERFSSLVSSFSFAEKIQQILTPQQQRIAIIFSLALGFLAAIFVLKKCCFKAFKLPFHQFYAKNTQFQKQANFLKKAPKLIPQNAYATNITFQKKTDFLVENIEIKMEEDLGNGKKRISFSGGIIEGEVKSNRLNGQGKMISDSGVIYEGIFRDNTLINGKITCEDKIYEGKFTGLFYHLNGKGSITFADGTVISGHFEDDVIQGKGMISYPDGTTEYCTFLDGVVLKKNLESLQIQE